MSLRTAVKYGHTIGRKAYRYVKQADSLMPQIPRQIIPDCLSNLYNKGQHLVTKMQSVFCKTEKLEVQLEEERRMRKKAEFVEEQMEAIVIQAGGIGHDARNALIPIQTYLRSPDSIKENLLHHAVEALERTKKLVDELLDLSKDGRPPKKTKASPQKLVNNTISLVRQGVKDSNIKITKERALSEELSIKIDTDQISRVITNILINAVQSISEEGEIIISAEKLRVDPEDKLPLKYGEYICISIRDNGIGMSKETQEKIFEPFFTTKEQNGGTGLGLAISHLIIEKHDGHIGVESVAGVGTTFRIYLPAYES